MLTKKHINIDAGIDEKVLTKRIGRDRLTYAFNARSLRLYEYFKNSRESHGRHVFQFPHHLREAGADIFIFEEVKVDIDNYKEFVIDLRTPEQLNACRLSRKT